METKWKLLIAGGALFLLTRKKPTKGWQNPVEGKVTSGFGNRVHPVTKKVKFHNGVDIDVDAGTKVLAPSDGKVTKVYWSDLAGNQLIITHTNGFRTGYAHLTSSKVKVGQSVRKGQLVAYTGNTGSSTTGAHLHFTLTDPDGNKIDPQKHFKFS